MQTEAQRKRIRENYADAATHTLESVVRYNTASCNAAATAGIQNDLIDEKRMVAEVAAEILRERQA